MTNEELILKKLDELAADVKRIELEQVRQGARLDAHITHVRENKADANERWKVGGIIAGVVGAFVAVVTAISHFFKG